MYIKNVQQVYEKARQCSVQPMRIQDQYLVTSPTEVSYVVDIHDPKQYSCSCPWGIYHPHSGCSHVIAAVAAREKNNGRSISAFERLERAKQQHAPLYKLNGVYLVSRKRRAR